MAPSHSRQLLVWTLPTIAIFLSYLWYKRKRLTFKNHPDQSVEKEDTGGSSSSSNNTLHNIDISTEDTSFKKSIVESTSIPKVSRSLSGVDSTPIDIVIPPKLKSSKSNPIVISDEDLDLEIKKIKSMKSSLVLDITKKDTSPFRDTTNKTPVSPPKESFTPTPTKVATSVIINSPSMKMAQKSMVEKLNSPINKNQTVTVKKLSPKGSKAKFEKINTKHDDGNKNNNSDELQRRNSERDSANHSPAEVMLASPSLSSISDNHSEGSNDSGKGGSDVATPPPSRTPGTELTSNLPTVYEFTIPQQYVGKLIGKRGYTVQLIKDKTGANIIVRKHPTDKQTKVCTVEGLQQEIDGALKMIRERFPLKRFPEVTLQQVSFYTQMPTVHLAPDQLYLKLIEGINNDTIVSCMVMPNHLFLQQHNHPTFPNLNILTNFMNKVYTETDSPLLPTPIPDNTICAAYSVNSWYRAMILSTDDETTTCYVKFLDYGGYAIVEQSKLRQIRGDFMLLPFQAAECFLANIKPVGDAWCEEAYDAVAEMTKGTVIYTQIADYTDEGIPLVFCYLLVGPQVVFLNEELVNQGYAEWLSSSTNDGGEAAGVTVA